VHCPLGVVGGFKVWLGDLPKAWTLQTDLHGWLPEDIGIVDFVLRTRGEGHTPYGIVTCQDAQGAEQLVHVVNSEWHWNEGVGSEGRPWARRATARFCTFA